MCVLIIRIDFFCKLNIWYALVMAMIDYWFEIELLVSWIIAKTEVTRFLACRQNYVFWRQTCKFFSKWFKAIIGDVWCRSNGGQELCDLNIDHLVSAWKSWLICNDTWIPTVQEWKYEQWWIYINWLFNIGSKVYF